MKLPVQQLSNPLWAACGINRTKGPFGALGITAASASNSQEIELFVALEDAVAGNVYIFAASQGLAAWFHNCDRTGLSGKLKLRPDQRVLFAQSVGYPERERRKGAA